MEKMTKPANILVKELMQHTMMESLEKEDQDVQLQEERRKNPKKHQPSEQMYRVYDCLPVLVHIIVVRVVAPQCDERAQAQSVRKENLGCCIQPHL